MVDVSIIIVSWNVRELLGACLKSILAAPVAFAPHPSYPHIEVIVVDSASTDDTVAHLATHFPQVRVLAQATNVGFTRGNNIGIAQAQGRHLLLLNPDTVVLGDAIGAMAHYLDANPRVGIVGTHTLNTDGTTQSTRRHFPTKRIAFFESTGLQAFAPPAWLAHYYISEPDDTATLPVDWVQGSCLMARREVYAQIGALDEGYIMFFEEMDWCKRAKLAGWDVHYLGDAHIIHHGGKSSEQIGAQKHIHFQQSKLRYFHKYHGAGFAWLLRAFLLFDYLVQLLLEGAKGVLGHKRDLRQARVRAYWQILQSGLVITNKG